MPQRKAPPWTSQEIAILHDIFPQEGIQGAADALPDRSWQAINVMASKLGIRSPIVGSAPELKLQGAPLAEAVRLRLEENWSFEKIGLRLGVCESSASNAVLIEIGRQRGCKHLERDEHGRFTAEGIERLRAELRKGTKAVDITILLGLSASRIAEERRRYRKDLKDRGKAPLPAPGAGVRYSGARFTAAERREVEALLLEGFGAQKVNERSGMSLTQIGRIRNRLVRRLRRKGQTLPGCDANGRRTVQKDSFRFIPAGAIAELRRRILDREPVSRAAKALAIGASSAYRIRDELKAELAAEGLDLPPPRDWRAEDVNSLAIIPGGAKGIYRYRALLRENPPEEALRILNAELDQAARGRLAAEHRAAEVGRAARNRPLTFEEQLERVRTGQATISRRFVFSKPGPEQTLGGIASAAL